jgi:hypothetical protein
MFDVRHVSIVFFFSLRKDADSMGMACTAAGGGWADRAFEVL